MRAWLTGGQKTKIVAGTGVSGDTAVSAEVSGQSLGHRLRTRRGDRGAGFLGSHLCAALLDGGARVVLDLALHFSFVEETGLTATIGWFARTLAPAGAA